MSGTSNLEVAILIDDLKVVSDISNVFRKMGIIPHFYQSLRDFWHGTLEQVPSFCLIDVCLMSEGELCIKDHPYVLNEVMNVAFYATEETAPLQYSTYDIFNLGVVESEKSLQGQIKSILMRLNDRLSSEENTLQDRIMLDKYEKQVDNLVSKVEAQKEADFYGNILMNLCRQFDEKVDTGDFFKACEEILGRSENIDQFAYLELNMNGQKLVSPNSGCSNFKSIPSLWLGQSCREGIEFFAQNMANQVALDVMGGEIISLMVRGRGANPDKILFIGSEDEGLINHFDWDFFENYLSGVFSRMEIKKTTTFVTMDKKISSWEMMDIVDRSFFTTFNEDLDEDHILIDINFSKLISVIRSAPEIRFYWNNFYTDFIARLESSYSYDYKLSPMGVGHIGLLVSKSDGNEFFAVLKMYASKFPYWRYFEDTEMVIGKDLLPQVRMVPLASDAYLRYIDTNEIFYSGNTLISTHEKEEEVPEELLRRPFVEKARPLEL